MLYRLTNSQFDYLIENTFRALEFKNGDIYYLCDKFTRLALVTLCSLLYRKLQGHSLVIDGIVRLSPECSWSSLKYEDLNCIARVLLFDYCSLTFDYGSYSPVINAYIDVLPITPFITFLNFIKKIDVVVPVHVSTTYYYNGKEFNSASDLWDYVHKYYPKSKYNVSLKF